ncbi:ImmA/IrrE family metallo-endopeptidase [Methanobacterium sp. YSL]|nr:ImmA/IrrE family metallo-endopeptidase [Methanobacterium sp. YSL]
MDKLLIQRRALQTRTKYNVDLNAPIDLFSLVSVDPTITLILYPFSEGVSGLCIKTAGVIAINSRSTLGRQTFSLAHELYHLEYDTEPASISYLSEDMSDARIEKEANLFASYLLMPDTGFTNYCQKITLNGSKPIDLHTIIQIEQYYRVSRNAVLVRLVMDGYLKSRDMAQFTTDISKNAKKLGYDTSLYFPLKNEEPKTYGAYLMKALELKNKGLISESKYEAYLLDAYRGDIVFDENGIENIYD